MSQFQFPLKKHSLRNPGAKTMALFVLSLTGLATQFPALAETRFVSSAEVAQNGDATDNALLAPSDGPQEAFPESAFGKAPARQTQAGSFAPLSAKNEVLDMENENSDGVAGGSRRGGRAPAGLQFDGETTGANGDVTVRTSNASDHPDTTRTVYQSQPYEVRMAQAGVTGLTDASPLGGDLTAQVSRHGVQEVAIIANDLGFFPKTIFVTRDVPVRLFVTGASRNTLCIMLDSFQVRKQVRANRIEEITFTPSMPGRYRFYCPVNGMEGSLVVKELTTDLPPVAPRGASTERVPAAVQAQAKP